ncbi:hypothetical protein EES37_38110 [Streptomyces sp. ADI91-18]|uniref:hypothetical protein n=1 Tax=Streptomyces sp. ADI91-18 TaxID=1522755 RepID=UPI000F55723F|nr:hypothetical protein [Streptomyces sp. ADI91-18]RPK23575.1 hypothetical protein EES37_38110 [Streptomyces sp. ADI91-18]
MATRALTVDGFLCAVPTPGTRPGTVQFELISSPTDDAADDMVFSCTTEESRIANALLTEIQPGDLLHVTGLLTQPDNPADPARLTVDALELLATAPARALEEMVLDRYGDYVVVFDADTDAVPVFTAQGQWVGLADNPDTIAALINIHERVTGGDA